MNIWLLYLLFCGSASFYECPIRKVVFLFGSDTLYLSFYGNKIKAAHKIYVYLALLPDKDRLSADKCFFDIDIHDAIGRHLRRVPGQDNKIC